MHVTYDPWIVALSYAVAVLAAYVALDMTSRVSAQVASGTGSRAARLYLLGGASAMGLGIWSMHFVGMLAFSLPIPVPYDFTVTLLSLGFAVLSSALALHTVSGARLTLRRLVGSGVIMGGGIVLMHYTGMAAIQVRPWVRYDPRLFAASAAIAIGASIVALWICFELRAATVRHRNWKRLGSALIMGAAIWGMHFTGMAAARFAPDSYCLSAPGAMSQAWLAIAVGLLSPFVLLTTLLAASFFSATTLRQRFALGILGVTLVPMAAVLITLYVQMRHSAEEGVAGQIERRVNVSAQRVNEAVDTFANNLRVLSLNPMFRLQSALEVEAVFRRSLLYLPMLARLELVDRAGVIVATTAAARRGRALLRTEPGLVTLEREALLASPDALFVTTSHDGAFLALSGVSDAAGASFAVLIATLDSAYLARIAGVQPGQESGTHSFLVDDTGMVVLSNDPAVKAGAPLPFAAALLAAAPPRGSLNPAVTSSGGTVASYARLEPYGDNRLAPWTLVSTESTASVLAPMHRLFGLIALVMMVFTVAAVLVGARLAAAIVGPLEELIRAARDLGAGNGAARARTAGNKMELDELAMTFNQMADRVAARTAELTAAQSEVVELSRMSGMAEVATSVLHNVGNALNSVNVSAGLIRSTVQKARADGLGRVVELLRAREQDLGEFFTRDPRGQHLVPHLAQLAERLAADRAAIATEAETLTHSIDHIKEVVSTQQSYARGGVVEETLNAVALVEDCLRMSAESLSRHSVEVVREFGPVGPLKAEKHKILQILMNLVANAKYACEDARRADAKVTVRVADSGSGVRIEVADNGVGIPAENMTRIYNHGFTTRKGGHGFGLHGCALAAKSMGGSLRASSEGPGRGATFTLELPR